MADNQDMNETLDAVSLRGPSDAMANAAADPTAPTLEWSFERSTPPPSPGVRLLSKSGSGFSNETASLLRSRLAAYSLITFVVLAIGFAGSIVNPQPLLLFRLVILLVIFAAAASLRFGREFSLRHLRSIEAVCVASLLLQVCAMAWLRIESFVNEGDLPSSVAASQVLYTLLCLVILAYGTFIPNTWRRATLVLLPIAAIPSVLLGIMEATNPTFAAMTQQFQLAKPFPETLVAAGIAVFASHVIQGVRREAFEAKQLGQYVLRKCIGSGGMGEVYQAEHRMLKRPCAIKLIRPGTTNTDAAIDRFEVEVRATAKLSHWNSVEVYDYGRTEDGTFYYVMELLPGANLEEIVLRSGPMPPSRVVHFLVQVCDALEEAHGQGLIHRDIKPANIFSARRGGIDDVAKLLDFGLVRQSDGDAGPARTFSGTPQYMPPEQATNYAEVDARGDLYALGAVAYFLLTGAPPFQGSVAEILLMHQRAKPDRLLERNPDIPVELEACVQRCLAKHPAERYQTAAELRQALLECPGIAPWSHKDARQWWNEHVNDSSEDNEVTDSFSQTLVMPATMDVAKQGQPDC